MSLGLFDQLDNPRRDWTWVDGFDPRGDPRPRRRDDADTDGAAAAADALPAADGVDPPSDPPAADVPRPDPDDADGRDDDPRNGPDRRTVEEDGLAELERFTASRRRDPLWGDAPATPEPGPSPYGDAPAPPMPPDATETTVIPAVREQSPDASEPGRSATPDAKRRRRWMIPLIIVGVLVALFALLVLVAPSGPARVSEGDASKALTALRTADGRLAKLAGDKETRRLAGDKLAARMDSRHKANARLLGRSDAKDMDETGLDEVGSATKETRRLSDSVAGTVKAARLMEARTGLEDALSQARSLAASTTRDDVTGGALDDLDRLVKEADKTRSSTDADRIARMRESLAKAMDAVRGKADESRKAEEARRQAEQEAQQQAGQQAQQQAQTPQQATPRRSTAPPVQSAPSGGSGSTGSGGGSATPAAPPQDNTGVNVG